MLTKYNLLKNSRTCIAPLSSSTSFPEHVPLPET
jgi:hypothetical protein